MSKEKTKITEIGQPCRHCGTPVIKKQTKDRPRSKRKNYYYEFILFCTKCKAVYLVEEWKKHWGDKIINNT